MSAWDYAERVDAFAQFGVRAFTTTRAAGDFGWQSPDPHRDVLGRWMALRHDLGDHVPRLACSHQVHGDRVVLHGRGDGPSGWIRVDDADGHVAAARGTALAVTIADCVPIFVCHASGVVGLLHSGWRGTAAGILHRALTILTALSLAPHDLWIHLGPSICGGCYEVSPEVYGRVTGLSVDRPAHLDLRSVIAGQARSAGVRHLSISSHCTRCDARRFFSHRAGDTGRQVAVVAAPLQLG